LRRRPPQDEDVPVIDEGGIMRGKIRVFAAAASIAALALVVSLVSASVAGPNMTRLVVIEHATTDTVVDLTTNGDSTGDLLTFHNELFDETDPTWSVPTRASASGSRSV
jgi:hypothetical protein